MEDLERRVAIDFCSVMVKSGVAFGLLMKRTPSLEGRIRLAGCLSVAIYSVSGLVGFPCDTFSFANSAFTASEPADEVAFEASMMEL